MRPTGRPFDKGQAQRIVDRSQTGHSHAGAKLVEHSRVRPTMAMGEPRKLAPSALFGQQRH